MPEKNKTKFKQVSRLLYKSLPSTTDYRRQGGLKWESADSNE
jgi:hypothetical protein